MVCTRWHQQQCPVACGMHHVGMGRAAETASEAAGHAAATKIFCEQQGGKETLFVVERGGSEGARVRGERSGLHADGVIMTPNQRGQGRVVYIMVVGVMEEGGTGRDQSR